MDAKREGRHPVRTAADVRAGRQPVRERSSTDIDWGTLLPEVARRLLGEPTRTLRGEWRYGNKGSLKVNLSGHPHAGKWYCFESGAGWRRPRPC